MGIETVAIVILQLLLSSEGHRRSVRPIRICNLFPSGYQRVLITLESTVPSEICLSSVLAMAEGGLFYQQLLFPNCLKILYIIPQSLLNSEYFLFLKNKAAVAKYHKLGDVHIEMHCLAALEPMFEIMVLAGVRFFLNEGKDLFQASLIGLWISSSCSHGMSVSKFPSSIGTPVRSAPSSMIPF